MKRSWRREDAKKGGSALHTDKSFIRNWFLVCKLGYPRKKMGVEHIYTAGISKPVISPMEILDKTKLFIPEKSCKIIWHLLGTKPNSFLFYFFFAPENCNFLFSPRNFHIVFVQYSWKIQVLE